MTDWPNKIVLHRRQMIEAWTPYAECRPGALVVDRCREDDHQTYVRVSDAEARIEELEKALAAFTVFWQRCRAAFFEGCDIDGWQAQEWGVELGLLQAEVFDPDDKHADLADVFEGEKGDTIYMETALARLKSAKEE